MNKIYKIDGLTINGGGVIFYVRVQSKFEAAVSIMRAI